MNGKLLIVRHGESEWNAKGVWTGVTDIHLSEKGVKEAEMLGEAIQDIPITRAFCSQQVRSLETLTAMLSASNQPEVPFVQDDAINERDYGVYTGKNKWEVQQEIGNTAFEKLRRGWDDHVEGGETLKDVYARAVPFYKTTILPLLQKGENVLVVAHGNSIRSLVKYIESISDRDITTVEMLFGEILIYQVDAVGKQVTKKIRKIKTTPETA